MAGLVKWLQSVGVGLVYAIYDYIQTAAPSSGDALESVLSGVVLALVVRGLGLVVGKLPPRPA